MVTRQNPPNLETAGHRLCILAEVAANVSVELRNRATEKPPRVELKAGGSGPGWRRVCGMGVWGACVWLRKLNLQPGI